MTGNSDIHMHSLMTDMQIAYYMALLIKNAKHKDGLQAMRKCARSAIQQQRIPRSLYIFANAFIKGKDPLVMVEKTYDIFHEDHGVPYGNGAEAEANGSVLA